ncbi:MAG: hypothetical protein EZS28_038243 [Streblomastix strix]|uniref:Uncharacterized protein n=1 Tax=Streblomastix strix TaxID=222440 RepID=A0A5J4U8I7_9EUKA|nr:MAG: hypothetical protein EZS28_038243 [Streblomastix strix]
MIRSISSDQIDSNIGFSHINSQTPAKHKGASPPPQSDSPTVEETKYLFRIISPEESQGEKIREPESKKTQKQQYAGIIEVMDKFHKLMEPVIQQEKTKPKEFLPGQYKEQPNKDGSPFFLPTQKLLPDSYTMTQRPKSILRGIVTIQRGHS